MDEMAPGRTPSSDRPPRRLSGLPSYEREKFATGAIVETSNADVTPANEFERAEVKLDRQAARALAQGIYTT
jgi:hypothetical protein